MGIDQQIYHLLLDNAGGQITKIKGINRVLLTKMRKGESKTKFSELFEALFENGISKATLHSEHTTMDICVEGKQLTVTTKKINN